MEAAHQKETTGPLPAPLFFTSGWNRPLGGPAPAGTAPGKRKRHLSNWPSALLVARKCWSLELRLTEHLLYTSGRDTPVTLTRWVPQHRTHRFPDDKS